MLDVGLSPFRLESTGSQVHSVLIDNIYFRSAAPPAAVLQPQLRGFRLDVDGSDARSFTDGMAAAGRYQQADDRMALMDVRGANVYLTRVTFEGAGSVSALSAPEVIAPISLLLTVGGAAYCEGTRSYVVPMAAQASPFG